MSRYGPPDDPNYYSEQPYAYSGYGQEPPPGGPPGGPPEEPGVPWYRKPWALVGFGALGALLLALLVFWIFGGSNAGDSEPLTPLTTAPTTAPITTTPATTTPTTTETTTTTTTTTTEPTTTTTTTTTTPTTTVETSTSTVTETITIPSIPGLPPPP